MEYRKWHVQADPTCFGSKLQQPAPAPSYHNRAHFQAILNNSDFNLLQPIPTPSFNRLKLQSTPTSSGLKLLQPVPASDPSYGSGSKQLHPAPAPSYCDRLFYPCYSNWLLLQATEPASSYCSGSKPRLRLQATAPAPSKTIISLFSWRPVER